MLYRALPNLEAELGKLETTQDNSFRADYREKTESKQWGPWLTHRIKPLYGFNPLLKFNEDKDTRALARKQSGYLMT